ncbi:cold-regulated protein 27-like isoform X2 [Phragmites australis]|uniref:cold-regulated protein 27-like isoform X2 n=1 Tax=Phragmites australis TaxID=29695 RepID=UPI002D76A296|nr:cold-regulated protein 27-like isoform X2 [Phragmites australis]
MGDVSLNQPWINDEAPPCSIAKRDQVQGLRSAGWTNERHNSYISSMEASFVEQLYGHENHGLDVNKRHFGNNGFKVIQEGLCNNLRFERKDVHPHDGGIRCLPENPWIRRFRPRNVGVNRHGDGVEASVDDYGSGTDTVREKVRTHGREVKTCAEENFIGKSKEVSDQNFSEEEFGANDEPCKKKRPTSSSAVPNDQPT